MATARQGTQGGSVPNTATSLDGGSSPLAVVIALAMLFGLSAATMAVVRVRAR